MKFCIVIPAYNASATLDELLKRIETSVSNVDIIVVDDGSTDDTPKIASNHNVILISHDVNRGKGSALKTGFSEAIVREYDAVITLDSDLQHPPELICEFTNKLSENFDMVIGNRMFDTAQMPIERKISNKLSSFTTSILAGMKISDSQCGFRAIKSWVIKSSRFFTNKYEIESEMIVEAARLDANITFVKIPTIYGSISHFNKLIDTLRFIWFVIAYFPRRWINK